MVFTLDDLTAYLLAYKYVILFPAAVIEGPIVTILAGFFISHGYIEIASAFTVIVVADLVSDSLYYMIGRWGRKLIDHWKITADRINDLETHFSQHSGKTLIIGKLTQGIGAVILMAAGAAQVPFGSFIWFNFIAIIPKSLVLLLVGFYFGQAYMHIHRYLNYTALGFIAIGICAVIVYFRGIKKVVKKAARNATIDPKT